MVPERRVYLREIRLPRVSGIVRQFESTRGQVPRLSKLHEGKNTRIENHHLHSPILMVNIVVRGGLLVNPLEWVPRERVAAVVIDTFHDREIDKP